MTARVIDGKVAVTELVQELDRTRRDLAKATLAVTQAETNALQLREGLAARDRIVAQLRQELLERDASHRLEVAAVATGSDAQSAATTQKAQFLADEVARLKREVEVAGDYVAQNAQLREVLTQCHAALAELHRANAELRAQMASDVQARTASLEQEFSRRLLESERRLRQDAFNALSEESRVALAGNDKMQTVLQRQNETLDSVLQRCRHLEEAHAKVDEERRAIESDTTAQQREIERLHRVLGDAGERAQQLEDALRQRRVERASFELLFVDHAALKRDLEAEREACRRAVREAARWRDRAYALTEQLGADERRDAARALVAIAQHSDLLERNAERNERRRERMQRARDDNARVAQAARALDVTSPSSGPAQAAAPTGGAGSARAFDDDADEGDDGAGSPLPPRDAPLRVNALDILAIWNVNYHDADSGVEAPPRLGNAPPAPTGVAGEPGASQQQPQHQRQRAPAAGPRAAQAPPATLPPLLRASVDRAQNDAALSVVVAPRPTLPHNVRRMKESQRRAPAHARAPAETSSDALSLTGAKQATPAL
jgi:hypothetical protein